MSKCPRLGSYCCHARALITLNAEPTPPGVAFIHDSEGSVFRSDVILLTAPRFLRCVLRCQRGFGAILRMPAGFPWGSWPWAGGIGKLFCNFQKGQSQKSRKRLKSQNRNTNQILYRTQDLPILSKRSKPPTSTYAYAATLYASKQGDSRSSHVAATSEAITQVELRVVTVTTSVKRGNHENIMEIDVSLEFLYQTVTQTIFSGEHARDIKRSWPQITNPSLIPTRCYD